MTILTEDFEGDFPSGLWSVGSGNYTWAKRNVIAHNGSNSAWAIGGGTVGSTLNYGAYYPNSTITTMIYGPFDLSDANWAALSFFVWVNTEQDYDFFQFMASDDGANFNGYALSGTSDGAWLNYSLPLTAIPDGDNLKNFTGKSAVWIAFAFLSDNIVNQPNGVFVDDVILQKGTAQVPMIIASFPTPGTSSRGLAWDGANLWCSDATNDRIYKLNSSGGVLTSFTSPGTMPTGMTWDGTNLWNADATNDRIYKLSTTGSVLSSFTAPGSYPSGITWDGAYLWNSDYGVETIWSLNASGSVLSSFSAPGSYHYGLTYDGQNLWLVDADVLLMYKIDRSGNVLDYCLTPETWPSGLAWDGNYFWMTDRSTNMIYKMQLQTQQLSNDVGGVSMDLPARLSPGDSTLIIINVKNYGTTSQSNFPVSYNINGGMTVTESYTGSLAAGATSAMTFTKTWRPTLEGSYQFMAWTNLAGDENPANDSLATPQIIEVSNVQIADVFIEDFEKYPTGVLADAPGSPWVRYSSSRNGNVTTKWVHGGQQNFQINSFTTSTEIDYALLNLTQKPDQLNVELWYTPDGFYIYKDFASVGLSYVASKYDMTQKASFWGEDHDVKFMAEGMGSAVTVFNELDYGSGPAPSGTPKHNYIRAEFDFKQSEVRFFIGSNSSSPLRSKVNFDNRIEVNALFLAGGLNETYVDDIRVTALSQPQYQNDVGTIAMDLPDVVNLGASVPVGVIVQNFGTVEQSTLPVSYCIDGGAAITENLIGTLAAGASIKKSFSIPWTPSAQGTFQFTAWTGLVGDENAVNDSLPTPKQVTVQSGGSNTDPVLSSIGNQSVTAGQTKNVPLSATDTDGDALNFTISENPGFLSITGFSQTGNTATATLVISPSFNNVGSFTSDVQVSDGRGGVDNENFTIEVITASKGAWAYQNPLNGKGNSRAVHFVDAQTGWMVNNYGEIRKTTDGGAVWFIQHDINFELTDIFFINSQIGWTVGASFSGSNPQAPILKTTDGGTSWILQSTSAAHRLWSVYFVSDQVGWAVGINSDYKDIILRTCDGGLTWNVQKTESSSNETYNSVHFVDAQTGWVVGWNSGNPDIILKTTDGGASWNSQTTSANSGLQSVFFIDTQTGWAAGGSNIIKTTNGGTTWTEQSSGTSNSLESIRFINSQEGWAVGSSSYGELGTIIKTTNGGATWIKQNSGSSHSSNAYLDDVYFVNSNTGWAVGNYGMVLKTTDGGSNWTNLSFVTIDNLNSIFFLDASNGWAGGKWGNLLKTTTGGKQWTPVSAPYGYQNTDIHFADSKTGWVCQSGGTIMKTSNGGLSWSKISTATTKTFLGLFFIDARTGWAVGGGSVSRIIFKTNDSGNVWSQQTVSDGSALMDVFFIDANTGWTVGMNGAIFKTTDGGNTWLQQNSGSTDWLECVYFIDANNGFVGGSNGILKTSNGGTTWTFDDVGAGWIDDIFFVDPYNGFAVGATGSTLSKGIDGSGDIDVSGGSAKTWITTDGGATWDETVPSVGGWLLRSCFTDRNSGWAVSTVGTIVKYSNSLPLPAAPSNLIVNSIADNKIKLGWSDNSTNEDGYQLFRSDGISGAFRLIKSIGADTTDHMDSTVTKGTTYWYRIRAYNAIGNSAYSMEESATAGTISSVTNENDIVTRFALKQNYPNPFNPSTVIQYSIPKASQVELAVFDLLGRKLKVIVTGKQEAGIYYIKFDSQNLPAGLYFYRLRTGEFCETKKMVVVK
ncbi:MAG: YCF48-related protein [Candidatus Zhuqueibacterota bacterium]